MTPPGRSEGELALWAPIDREVRTGSWHEQAEPTADRIEAARREGRHRDANVEFLEYNWACPEEYYDGEHHCWLYHDLCDNQSLDLRDLLRIGAIGVDFKVIYQEYIELKQVR